MTVPKGLLFDVTSCTLCGACWLADKERNSLPIPCGDFTHEPLSENAFLAMELHSGRGVRRSCMHCLNPACASACPVAALEKTALGPVVYHRDRCIGCRYCLVACPFSIPKYEWSKPLPYVRKCDFCNSRILAGQQPACAAACPTGALIFGDRGALLDIARQRIYGAPDRYLNRIYGEREAGGTSLLILSDVPLEKLGYPEGMPGSSLPAFTWQALENVPRVAAIGGTFLAGLWWLTKRRRAVMLAEERGTRGSVETDAAGKGKS